MYVNVKIPGDFPFMLRHVTISVDHNEDDNGAHYDISHSILAVQSLYVIR